MSENLSRVVFIVTLFYLDAVVCSKGRTLIDGNQTAEGDFFNKYGTGCPELSWNKGCKTICCYPCQHSQLAWVCMGRMFTFVCLFVCLSVCLSVRLSVCSSVCPQHNLKTNDPKVLKFGIGNDLGIS